MEASGSAQCPVMITAGDQAQRESARERPRTVNPFLHLPRAIVRRTKGKWERERERNRRICVLIKCPSLSLKTEKLLPLLLLLHHSVRFFTGNKTVSHRLLIHFQYPLTHSFKCNSIITPLSGNLSLCVCVSISILASATFPLPV